MECDIVQKGPEAIVHATLIDNTLQSSRTILGFRSIKKGPRNHSTTVYHV